MITSILLAAAAGFSGIGIITTVVAHKKHESLLAALKGEIQTAKSDISIVKAKLVGNSASTTPPAPPSAA